MADAEYIPEGYTAEEWSGMLECSKALNFGPHIPSLPVIPPALAATPEKLGVVYFIGGDVGLIKIGFTTNLESRLSRLNGSSPIRLKVLASVETIASEERAYHLRFYRHRRHHEWFERHPDIIAEIERLNTPAPDPGQYRGVGR